MCICPPFVIVRHWLFALILHLVSSLPLLQAFYSLSDPLSGAPDIRLPFFFSCFSEISNLSCLQMCPILTTLLR